MFLNSATHETSVCVVQARKGDWKISWDFVYFSLLGFLKLDADAVVFKVEAFAQRRGVPHGRPAGHSRADVKGVDGLFCGVVARLERGPCVACFCVLVFVKRRRARGREDVCQRNT